MEKEIISKIAKSSIKRAEEEQFPLFSDKRYKPYKISRENFHEIKPMNSNSKIAFIDGGNMEIMGGADFSLHLARVYCTIYKNNKRIKSKKSEFYVLASAFADGKEIKYRAEIFPENAAALEKGFLVFDSFDSTIREGNNRLRIPKICEIVRKFAEINAAAEITKELERGDIIVRDGSLQATVTNESKLLDELYKKTAEKNIIVTALSKTSTLLTDKGNSLSAAIKNISPKGKWHYHPVAEASNPDHRAEIFFIKLNEKSRHVFRFEVYKENGFDINKILSLLSENSKDPTFIGYPYGLIEADKFARVTEEEAKSRRMKFMFLSGKEWADIGERESAVDAHDMLV